MNRALVLGTMAFICWIMLTGGSFACQCPMTPTTAKQVMRGTPVMFWGRAISEKVENSFRYYEVEIWSGNAVLPQTVKIRTPQHSGTCGAELPLDQPELIAGFPDPHHQTIGIFLCSQLLVKRHKAALGGMLRSCTPFKACP